MSSVQHLREFISARLTAAAEEIFSEFEKTIEEEIDRRHRLLDISWKPQPTLHKLDLPQRHIHEKEDAIADRQLCDQEKNSSLVQEEFPEIKEEQDELCTTEELEQFVLKQESNDSILFSIYQRGDVSEAEPNAGQPFPLPEIQNQEGNQHTESTGGMDMRPKRRSQRNRSHSKEEDNSPTSQIQFDSDRRKSVEFNVCGKSFRNETEMEEHSGVKPHAKPTRKKIWSHTRIQKGEKLQSERCGKGFSQSRPLIHLNPQANEMPFLCNTCGNGFNTHHQLLLHSRVHTGENVYSCKICGKCFTQRGSLSRHRRSHVGERTYSCKTCGKGFTQQYNLLRHKRIHTGEKPFSCGICGRNFSQRSHLLPHMTVHTGEKPHTCGTCGKGFGRKDSLRVHLKSHTRKK